MYRILLLLCALALRLSAQETIFREVFDPKTDTHVEVLALFSKPSPTGFLPVRVKISNQLKTDRPIHLSFKSGGWHQTTSTSSSFSFHTPAGKTLTHDILVPLCPPPAVRHNGTTRVQTNLSGTLGSADNYLNAEYSHDQPAVLLSEALYTPNASALNNESNTKHSGGYRSGSSEFAARFDPKQLPDNWLAFSGYDSVLMLDSDWMDASPGARNAILSWVRLGGQLIVYTSTSATATAGSLGLPHDPGFGHIHILPIAPTLDLPPKETVDQVSFSLASHPRHSALRGDFESHWPLQAHFGQRDFHYAIFIVVLILFGVLVGPVNLFVFAKSGMRHRLFLTTPAISLGASALLIALIIFQDGFGGNGMRRILMEVRPGEGQNAAFLHQEQISRTGVLARSRFTVDPAAAIHPVPIAASRWARYTSGRENQGSFNLQPSDGKLLASGDWFQSRSEHGHALSAVISTRGRIESTGEALTHISTFEFPIETLYYLDENGSWHKAENITAGQRFTLTPLEQSFAIPALNQEADAFSKRNQEFLKKVQNRPGHFVAVTSHAPGIDTNPGIRWSETRTVITGPVFHP